MLDALTVVLLGVPMTLVVTAGAFLLGLVVSIPLLMLSRSRFTPVRWLGRITIDLLRGIPPIVWLFLIYFGITIGTIRISALQAGIIGLGLISAGYLAEIFRGSIAGVARGQWEAGEALGLSRATLAGTVIAPQALRMALPSTTTYVIGLLKDSSIASTIGVTEIVYRSDQFARQTQSGLLVFLLAAGVYIALSVPLALQSRKWDAKMRRAVSR